MNKLFYMCLAGFMACQTLKAAEINQPYEIQEVIPNDLYVCSIAPDYHYVVERVNDETRPFWKKFGNQQMVHLNNHRSVHNIQSTDGVQGFNSVMRNEQPDYLYVTYVTRQTVNTLMSVKYDDIEMSFCILTDGDLPWSSHMGISRNPFYNRAGHLQHKNIATTLHSFAAKVIKLLYPQKIYMITKPVKTMWNILLDTIPQGKLFIGHKADKQKWIENSQQGQELFNSLQRNPLVTNMCFDPFGKIEQILNKYESPIILADPKTESHISFTLKNQMGEVILSLTEADKEKHGWFFEEYTCFQGLTLRYPLCTIDLETLANLSPYWAKITEFKKVV